MGSVFVCRSVSLLLSNMESQKGAHMNCFRFHVSLGIVWWSIHSKPCTVPLRPLLVWHFALGEVTAVLKVSRYRHSDNPTELRKLQRKTWGCKVSGLGEGHRAWLVEVFVFFVSA